MLIENRMRFFHLNTLVNYLILKKACDVLCNKYHRSILGLHAVNMKLNE
jgi:hypothetical protein